MFRMKNGDIVLFQGDSITDGNRGRNQDPNHIHGHGYQYILASEMYADNTDIDFEVVNRGVSGDRIAKLYGRWKEDCLNVNPDILSILIGINDCSEVYCHNNGSMPDRYKKIYRYMLDEFLEQNPNALIVIMEPFFGVSEDEAYNAYMQAHVCEYAKAAREIAEEYGSVFVPLQDVFDKYAEHTDIFKLLWDGVHPTTGGHQLIARRWKECVEEKLNAR